MLRVTDWFEDNLSLVRGGGSFAVVALLAAALHRTGRFSRIRSIKDVLPGDYDGSFRLRSRLHRALGPASLLAVHQPLGHRLLNFGAKVSRDKVSISEATECLPVRIWGVCMSADGNAITGAARHGDAVEGGEDGDATFRHGNKGRAAVTSDGRSNPRPAGPEWCAFVEQHFVAPERTVMITPLFADPVVPSRMVSDVHYFGPSFVSSSLTSSSLPPSTFFLSPSRWGLAVRDFALRLLAPLPLRRSLAEEAIQAGAARLDVHAVEEFLVASKSRSSSVNDSNINKRESERWRILLKLEALEEDARKLRRGAWP